MYCMCCLKDSIRALQWNHSLICRNGLYVWTLSHGCQTHGFMLTFHDVFPFAELGVWPVRDASGHRPPVWHPCSLSSPILLHLRLLLTRIWHKVHIEQIVLLTTSCFQLKKKWFESHDVEHYKAIQINNNGSNKLLTPFLLES